MKFTNYTQGPKGVRNTSGDVIMIEAGQSADVDANDAEAESAKATGWFAKDGGPLDRDEDGAPGGSKPAETVALTGKNKDDLLAIAKDEGVEADDSMTNKEIREAIEFKRG